MDQVPVSEFKIHCLAILARVSKSGEPILITRFGKPLAQISSPSPQPRAQRHLARAAGTIQILGDIMSPPTDPADWDALR